MTALLAIIPEVIRTIGITGCVVLGLLAYYEGVPGLRDIPYVDEIPVVRELVAGRVKTVAAQSAKDATAGLVTQARLDEANARADELERQATFNASMAFSARQQANRARIEADAARDELEKRIAAETDPSASHWNATDCQRVRCH